MSLATVHERFRSVPSGLLTYWPGFAVTAADTIIQATEGSATWKFTATSTEN